MGSFSIWHWMLFLAVALLLFGGKGKISDIMGDVAKGDEIVQEGHGRRRDDRREGGRPGAQPRKSRRRARSTSTTSKKSADCPNEFALETPYRGRARAVARLSLARPLHVRS